MAYYTTIANITIRNPISSSISHVYPLVICYIAMENGHRNSGFSIKTGDFP